MYCQLLISSPMIYMSSLPNTFSTSYLLLSKQLVGSRRGGDGMWLESLLTVLRSHSGSVTSIEGPVMQEMYSGSHPVLPLRAFQSQQLQTLLPFQSQPLYVSQNVGSTSGENTCDMQHFPQVSPLSPSAHCFYSP